MNTHRSRIGLVATLIVGVVALIMVPAIADDHKESSSRPSSGPTSGPAAKADYDPELDDRPTTGTARVVVKWGIESAVDNFGYLVYRTTDLENEPFEPITKRILKGVGTTADPKILRYIDTDVELDIVYYYKVEEIGRDNNRTFFPNPVTNEVMILAGKPKIMNKREEMKYGEEKFHIEDNVRSGKSGK